MESIIYYKISPVNEIKYIFYKITQSNEIYMLLF